MSYIDELNLLRDPFSDYVDAASFFPYTKLTETVASVCRLVEATHRVVLISGDPGSGKTLMVKQVLAVDEESWSVCSLQLPIGGAPLRAYTMARDGLPVVMVDDAHRLEPETLASLIKMTTGEDEDRQFKMVILTGLPHTAALLDTLRHLVPESGGIQEVPLPPMTLDEVQTYLAGRLRSAGHTGELPFTDGQVMRIHIHSGGFPGAVNAEAAKELAQTHAGEEATPPPKKGLLGRLFGR